MVRFLRFYNPLAALSKKSTCRSVSSLIQVFLTFKNASAFLPRRARRVSAFRCARNTIRRA